MAVGDRYVKSLLGSIDKIDLNKWDIHIYTDQPDKFSKYGKVHWYPYVIFSYFEKLLFVIRTVKETGKGAVWFDADKLYLVSDKFLDFEHNYNEFRYYSKNRWVPYFWEEKFPGTWSVVREYFKYLDVDYRSIVNLWEEVWYMPFHYNLDNMLADLEMVKPVFEYRSVIDEFSRNGVGEGEGVALGYVLYKYGMKYEYFPCEVFPNNNPFHGHENHDEHIQPDVQPGRLIKRKLI